MSKSPPSGIDPPSTGDEMSAAANVDFAQPSVMWRFFVLIEIENIGAIRRKLGVAGTNKLASTMAGIIADKIYGSETLAVGRGLIEVIQSSPDRGLLARTIDAVGEILASPLTIEGMAFKLEASIGAAALPDGPDAEIKLTENAELALEAARTEHQPIVFDPERNRGRLDDSLLSRDLLSAIGTEQLFLHYQPKVHLRSQKVRSLEALIRWRHPVLGFVGPSDFIPVAERTRAIDALTLWTIEQVIRDQSLLRTHGHSLPIFVNIAAPLLSDDAFVDRALELAEASEASLGFEITETSLISKPDVAIANLKKFAGIGVTLAIDDYGAGLSSLAYLKQLPARELKIDKMFVTELTKSNRDPLIVRSTIDLAHALDMEVVAEGVESPGALALLSVMGCDLVQGFLISRPIALNELIAYLGQDISVSFAAFDAEIASRFRRHA